MTPAPPALAVRGVGRRYGGLVALDDVSFEVAPVTVHALLGANGSGKSTLIRILAGVERGEHGGHVAVDTSEVDVHRITAAWSRRAGVRVVHQGATGFPHLSVAENLALGTSYPTRGGAISWSALRRRTTELLGSFGLDVSPSTSLDALSPSAQTLVFVARAFADTADPSGAPGPTGDPGGRRLLVLDEPTAALPAHEVDVLLRGLRSVARSGHAVVLVTHRLDEVLRVADDVTVLRDGQVVRTFPLAAEPPDRIVDMICGDVAPVAPARAAHAAVAVDRRRPRLVVRSLAVGPIEDVSFEVAAGEVVGLAGLLGSGRSSILAALFCARPARAGTVEVDGEVLRLRHPADAMAAGVALVPERRDLAVLEDATVAENLSIASLDRVRRRFRIDGRAERALARADVADYGIVARDVADPITTLSGGNQQKVVLARWLRRLPRVLLLDEPTAGVDVGARAELHRIVRGQVARGAAAVLVSSDAEELCALSDRVLVLRGGGVGAELSGTDLDPGDLDRRVHLEVLR